MHPPPLSSRKEQKRLLQFVLCGIINSDVVLFCPLKGKGIAPAGGIKKVAAEFVMLWKNKYNSLGKISLLQKERSDREFLWHYRAGVLERRCGRR
jgi:hypothetical protein